MKPRPHCELIKKWADGYEIEGFINGKWVHTEPISFSEHVTYRLMDLSRVYRTFIFRDDCGKFKIGIVTKDQNMESDREKWGCFVRWESDWKQFKVY